jgi:hypothetical protein
MFFIIGRSENGSIRVKDLQGGMSPDAGVMIFSSMSKFLSFQFQEGYVFVKSADGKGRRPVPSQLVKDRN